MRKTKTKARAPSHTAIVKQVAKQLDGLRLDYLQDIRASNSVAIQRSESQWRGASQTLRSMTGWNARVTSGRSATIKPERDRLIARSQDAYRNHLIARSAIVRSRTNIVGTGLTAHPAVDQTTLGITEQQAEELNAIIAAEFQFYYDNPLEIDIEATHDGYGLQSLALLNAMISGDCWALTPFKERPGGIYGMKVQLIDGARVSNANDGPNTPTLCDGVEIDVDGEPIAIYVRSRHPGDLITLDSRPVNWDRRTIFGQGTGMRRVLQVWNDKDFIGQTRGIPYLAPILEPLQTLEQYSRAELMAAVISSMFTVFIKKDVEQVDERGERIPFVYGQTAKGEAAGLTLGMGAVLDLAPGEEAQMANPTRPNANYDPFFMSIVKQIGAALEIPADELMLNYQASYSAARAAMLQAWRFYTMRRWWLVQQFCQPLYQLWFDEAVARGRLPVEGYADPARRAAYTQALWVGPARGAMDESQEATAAKTRIDAGISNETIETAQMQGEAWIQVYRQRVREMRRRREDGMEIGPAPGQAAPAPQQNGKPRPAQTEPVVPDQQTED